MSAKQRIVAIEEHFWIPELRDRYSGPRGISAHTPARQLDDLGAIRLAARGRVLDFFQTIIRSPCSRHAFDSVCR